MTSGSSRRFQMMHRKPSSGGRRRDDVVAPRAQSYGNGNGNKDSGGSTSGEDTDDFLLSQMTCKQIIEGLGPSAKTVKLVAHQKQGW